MLFLHIRVISSDLGHFFCTQIVDMHINTILSQTPVLTGKNRFTKQNYNFFPSQQRYATKSIF